MAKANPKTATEEERGAAPVQVTEAKPDNLPVVSGGGDDFAAFAGAGMENVGASDVLVPRLTILQQLSPQLNERKGEFIPEARAGMICDVGLGEVWSGIRFLPVYYRKDWLEWAPRNTGKGLVAIHSDPSIVERCRRDEKNRLMLNGNLISETAQVFGFNLSAGMRRSFIPFASTQLKKARKWMAFAMDERLRRADGTEFQPPLFYRTYMLDGGALESNNDGDWYGWRVNRAEALPDLPSVMPGLDWRSLLKAAADFAEMLKSGAAKADTSSMGTEDHASASSGGDDERM
jgi:hypothetical protein